MNLHALYSTYSIVAHDPETGAMGVAVETHQMCVGAIVPWLLPGVGAVAVQAMTHPTFGSVALAMLSQGLSASRVVEGVLGGDDLRQRRQLAVVDVQGRVAAHTGERCIPHANHHVGEGYSVQANLMTRPTVIPAMRAAYENATGDLAARMMAALYAAQAEDGDVRGMQSAALMVVTGDRNAPMGDAYLYNLRVDESADPLAELARLVRLRYARHIDKQGFDALERGDRAGGLALWAQARELAPELEETAFWQAVSMAGKYADPQTAADILRPALAREPRRDHYIDLLRRLQANGIIERAGAADAVIAALSE
jgi:uncharacterized Ntn-hydrolase superfamily protein